MARPSRKRGAASNRASSEPGQPASLGRPPVISLDDILETATKLAGQVGVGALTMSMLAESLGVTAAALYHYIRNREALVALVVDAALNRVKEPPPGPWDLRLRTFERSVRKELRRIRLMLPETFEAGKPRAAYQRLFETGVKILSETGAGTQEVMLAYATVAAFMTGQLWFDNSTQNAASGEATYFSVSGAEGVFDSDDLFEYGLATVIDGVRKRLVP
ncbi:TetR/AcrR family transcriptional regulator [Mycobacterium sp. E796]|uniref:TetR/AcrR family transcriptional regulator n=1 Tax=Mycobacterium sp. E796 TaxID=1834151 RepID=UPI0009ED57E3|nr:TetR/AcrR family transcriptional regulator [Mycobacterium sp. E796]